jgi:hypothetical protein
MASSTVLRSISTSSCGRRRWSMIVTDFSSGLNQMVLRSFPSTFIHIFLRFKVQGSKVQGFKTQNPERGTLNLAIAGIYIFARAKSV